MEINNFESLKYFKSFCSLGTLCHSSQLLKRNKVKKCSYPFDWVFSNCDTIIHCIENDFKIFLDRSYYIIINDIKCGHSYYHEKMFNHHNPLNKDYNYFIRCVKRFRILLKSKQRKLFIMMYVNMKKSISDTNIDVIKQTIEFNNKFSKYTSNYILLIIYHIQNDVRHHYFEYKDNIHILYLYTTSLSDGKEFIDNNDNLYLDHIIKSKYSNETNSNSNCSLN
jgi:3-methyladenine DNA glycosylase AlkC